MENHRWVFFLHDTFQGQPVTSPDVDFWGPFFSSRGCSFREVCLFGGGGLFSLPQAAFLHLKNTFNGVSTTKSLWKWGPLAWTPGTSPSPPQQCGNLNFPGQTTANIKAVGNQGWCTEAGGWFPGFQAPKSAQQISSLNRRG